MVRIYALVVDAVTHGGVVLMEGDADPEVLAAAFAEEVEQWRDTPALVRLVSIRYPRRWRANPLRYIVQSRKRIERAPSIHEYEHPAYRAVVSEWRL